MIGGTLAVSQINRTFVLYYNAFLFCLPFLKHAESDLLDIVSMGTMPAAVMKHVPKVRLH